MPTHHKDMTITNTYVPNNRVSNYMKQTRIKGKIENSTIIVGDINMSSQ